MRLPTQWVIMMMVLILSRKVFTKKMFLWKYLLFPGYFAYIDSAYKAQLKSPLLPWKPFHRTVGLCLRFKYLMKTHSKSSLRIFLKEAKQEKPVLAWQLSGYHGEDWSLAQVVWSGADTTQVGESADTFNFALSIPKRSKQIPLWTCKRVSTIRLAEASAFLITEP